MILTDRFACFSTLVTSVLQLAIEDDVVTFDNGSGNSFSSGGSFLSKQNSMFRHNVTNGVKFVNVQYQKFS